MDSLFAKVVEKRDQKKLKKKAVSKRVTNLFSMVLNKKLPIILPEMMKEVEQPLTDESIASKFAEIGVELEPLTKLNQPVYKTTDGYQNRDLEVLDLVCMVLAQHKLSNRC